LLGVTGLTRVEFSNAYLMGTLASGLMLPYAGTIIDRVGVRQSAIWASVSLGIVLALLSQVDRMAASVAGFGFAETTAAYALLSVGFLGLRFAGQGLLTLVCRTMLGRWFERRRGLVSSISGPFASFAFAGSPLLLASWVSNSGWRGAWQEMALAIGVGMTFFAWFFFRESPEQCGLEMDGGIAPAVGVASESHESERPAVPTPRRDYTRAEALRTAAFWIVTLGIANHAMVGTGIALHIVDLGAEAGLTKAQSLGVFLPVMLIGGPTGIVMGMAIDRFPMRFLIMAMMLGQILMFGLAPHLGDPLLYVICLAGWGFSSGFYGPLTVAALPNFFGRTHLGAIQGVMMMVIVIASALGPAILAGAKAYFGSYETGLHCLALLPLIVLFAAPFTRDPQAL
jgi:MFS family permease